jgi:hypothetical protein
LYEDILGHLKRRGEKEIEKVAGIVLYVEEWRKLLLSRAVDMLSASPR